MRIAIAGRPGAGKSALFELLAHRAGPDGRRRLGSRRPADRPRRGSGPACWGVVASLPSRKTILARLVFQELEQKSGPVYPALSSERRDLLAQSELILLVIDLFNSGPEEWVAEANPQWRAGVEEYTICDLAVVETRRERLEKALKIGQKPNFPGEAERAVAFARAPRGGARPGVSLHRGRGTGAARLLVSERPAGPAGV